MSAEILRRVASLMRERAEAATRGPWFVDHVGDFGDKHAIIADVLRERYGNNALSFGEDHATANYVASWHPAVALAVADLLAMHANAIDEVNAIRDGFPAVEPDARFLAVARAYLGSTE